MGYDSLNKSLLFFAISDSGDVYGMTGVTVGLAAGWSPSVGHFFLEPAPESMSAATACTAIGSKVFGKAAMASGSIPVLWVDPAQSPTPIPGHPDPKIVSIVTQSSNHDGTVIAGITQNFKTFKFGAFFWRAGVRKNQGWEYIDQFPPGMVYGTIKALNDEGTIAFGGGPDATIEGFSGLRWTKAEGLELIPDIAGGVNDAGLDSCDSTGFRASGSASPPEEKWLASVWDPVNGWTLVGKVKGSHTGSSLLIDGSGFAGGGTSGFHASDDRTAFYWNARDGIRSVEDVLVNDYGLTEAVGWTLTDVDGISENGYFLTGRGIGPKGVENWWAEIRPFCYADCDDSTSPKGKNAGPPVLDIDDFICFQTKFALGDYLYADCDLNGYLEIDDFICFITKFAMGCD